MLQLYPVNQITVIMMLSTLLQCCIAIVLQIKLTIVVETELLLLLFFFFCEQNHVRYEFCSDFGKFSLEFFASNFAQKNAPRAVWVSSFGLRNRKTLLKEAMSRKCKVYDQLCVRTEHAVAHCKRSSRRMRKELEKC